MSIYDKVGKIWLRTWGFDIDNRRIGWIYTVHGKRYSLKPDGRINNSGKILFVEIEWSKGYSPVNNVAKYWTFLDSLRQRENNAQQVILWHFIMPTFDSYPTVVALSRYLGQRTERIYPGMFEYLQIDLTDIQVNIAGVNGDIVELHQRLQDLKIVFEDVVSYLMNDFDVWSYNGIIP